MAETLQNLIINGPVPPSLGEAEWQLPEKWGTGCPDHYSPTRTASLLLLIENAPALAGVAQWIECWPENQRVAGSIPSQGMCLSCGPSPLFGAT